MYLLIIQFIIYNLISVSFLLLIGYCSKLFFKNKTDSLIQNSFSSLIIGFTIFVLIGSIFKTNGITINLLLLIILIIFLYQKKKNLRTPIFNLINFRKLFVEIFVSIIILTPFFSYECYYFLNSTEFNFTVPFLDFSFYADVSSSLSEFGLENKGRALNQIIPEKNSGITPYHYFELWFNGIVSSIYKISPLKSLMLITYPILYTIVFNGLLALINVKLSIKSCITALLLLCVSAIIIPIYNEFELTKYYSGYVHTAILGFGRKYLTIYGFGICSLLYFQKKEYVISILMLLIIPITSIGTAPAIFSCLIFFSLLIALKKKIVKPLILVIIFIAGFIIFFKTFILNSDENYYENFALYQKIILNPFDINLYKIFIFSFIFPLTRVLLFYLPFLSIIFIFSKKTFSTENRILISISILLIIFGAFFASLFNGVLDSGQLLYNILPLFNLSLIILLIKIAESNFKVFIFMMFGLSIYNFLFYDSFIKYTSLEIYNNQTATFKNKCIEELNSSKSKPIVLFSLNDQNYSTGVLDSYTNRPCFFLGLNNKGIHLIDFNPFRMEQSTNKFSKLNNKYFKELEINQYIESRGYEKLLAYKIQYNFIKEFNIKHLYIQKNSVINKRLLDSLNIDKIFKDSITNDKFIILK